MKRAFHLQKILIPIDFSETASLALEHAAFMAKLAKAQVDLLYVMASHSFISSISHAFLGSKDEYEANIEATATERLKEMAAKIHHETGNTVNYHIVKGKIYDVINKSAEQFNSDLIIMGTHGASGFQEKFIGSNAYKVISHASCPVISVQTHAKKIGFRDIVLPIDNSHTSRQKVSPALELAKHYKSAIHIIGLMDPTNEEGRMKFEVKIGGVKNFVAEHGISHTEKIIYTEAHSQKAMEYAAEIDADLMVIMTDQDGGVFMGSGAQKIINHSKIPVMSISPKEGDPDKMTLGY